MPGKKHTSLDRVLGRLDSLDSVNLTNLVQRLAKERALMWAAASEGAPPAAGSRQDDIHAVRGQREWTCALEFA